MRLDDLYFRYAAENLLDGRLPPADISSFRTSYPQAISLAEVCIGTAPASVGLHGWRRAAGTQAVGVDPLRLHGALAALLSLPFRAVYRLS